VKFFIIVYTVTGCNWERAKEKWRGRFERRC